MTGTPTLPEEINETIRSALWMLHKGMSQVEIAERLGISRVYLSKFMRGHKGASLDTAGKMLALCGLRLNIEILPIESEE